VILALPAPAVFLTLYHPDFDGAEYLGIYGMSPSVRRELNHLSRLSSILEKDRAVRRVSYRALESIARRACGRTWPDFRDSSDYAATILALRQEKVVKGGAS
jgi:hypothetical protein